VHIKNCWAGKFFIAIIVGGSLKVSVWFNILRGFGSENLEVLVLQLKTGVSGAVYNVSLADTPASAKPPSAHASYHKRFWIFCAMAHFIFALFGITVQLSEETTLCHCKVGGLKVDIVKDTTNSVLRNFFRGGGIYPRIFFLGCSTNSVEDRRQRERGSGGR
jgi:hypothetical protein